MKGITDTVIFTAAGIAGGGSYAKFYPSNSLAIPYPKAISSPYETKDHNSLGTNKRSEIITGSSPSSPDVLPLLPPPSLSDKMHRL